MPSLSTSGWPVSIPSDAVEAVWLRSDSVSGGKDWIGVACPDRFIAFWGKTGTINQSKTRKVIGTPVSHLTAVMAGKVQKGYEVIAELHDPLPPQSSNPAAPPPSKKQSAIAKIVAAWRDEAPDDGRF